MTDVLEQPTNQLLPGLIQRPPELGRIRLGEKTEKGAPRRLNTFRLTSASKPLLEAAAQLYGGKVRAWAGAPDEGMWELITTVAEIDVLIPGRLAVISQSYELWQGGPCERRCDGTTEAISGSGCLCAAEGLEGPDRLCDIVTRLRVMLPRVPGLGVWRLDTSGYQAATTLPSTVTLLGQLMPGQWIPAVLRAEQRSKRERIAGGKVETHRFVVPVLDLPGTTIGQVAQIAAPESAPALLPENGGERAAAPTAKDRAAARRAELEAQAAPVAAAPADPSLPLPRGQCNVKSPRGEDCRLGLGHDPNADTGAAIHMAGNKRWSTPLGGPAGAGEPDASAEAVPPTASAGPIDEARRVFAGDVIDPDVRPDIGLLNQPERSAP